MEFRRTIHSLAARGVIAALVLGPLALGCSGQARHLGPDGGTNPPMDSGGADRPTGGTGGISGAGGTPPGVSPPFNPQPPLPLASRWSGAIVPEFTENYTFRVTATAPVRALIRGEQILRDWTRTGSRVATGSVWLAAGTSYDLLVEADASVADPGLIVEWESPSKHREPVPKSTVADKGLTRLDTVAPFFGGKLPTSTPSSAAVKAQAVSGNLGLTTVWSLTSTPSSPYLYAVGRQGQVKYFDPKLGNDTGKVLLDVSQGLFLGQDSGLVNMVFHPQYGVAGSPNRNYIYVYYIVAVGPAGNNRLSRFTVNEATNTVDKSTEVIMIQEPLPETLHRGGGMTFGRDGFLYVGLGEYGNPNNGQDFTHLTAGVIRIDVDQDPTKSHAIVKKSTAINQNYFIPNDNPFVGMPGVLEEYYTKGERNPHKVTMDSATGRIFTGNVGGNTATSHEEVNEVIKGGNYGWPFREGNQDLGAWTFYGSQAYPVAGRPATLIGTLQDPNLIMQRPTTCNGIDVQCPGTGQTTNGKCIIGGYVYHGNALPKLANRYLIGDCNLGVILATADDRAHGPLEYLFTAPFVGVVTFGQDRDGEVYIAGTDAQVYRLVPAGAPVGEPPLLISQTGVFTSAKDMTPAPGVIPYDVSTPLWSDGAKKKRWMIPPTDANQTIDFNADGSWNFPVGTVFVKHFELPQADGSFHRLETRFLVHGNDDRYYGVTYRWRADNSDADLQDSSSFNERVGNQTWHYPSRSECSQCHTSAANFVLGLKTAQLNRPLYYTSSGLTANMVNTLQGVGLFKSPLLPASLSQMPSVYNGTEFAQTRARAYLDANCSQCHRPGGPSRGDWDARFSTPLNMQKLIGVTPVEALGIAGAKLLAPQSLDTSILFKRLSALDGTGMPPLARNVLDDAAVSLIKAWIAGVNTQPRPGAPVATKNPGLSTRPNSPLTLSLAGTDPDGDALDYRISEMPSHGTLEGFGKDMVYTPHPDFAGTDAFTFVVSDGANASAAAAVQITVQ
jgi:uncharacterized repeat protein (TIGR03806 family)